MVSQCYGYANPNAVACSGSEGLSVTQHESTGDMCSMAHSEGMQLSQAAHYHTKHNRRASAVKHLSHLMQEVLEQWPQPACVQAQRHAGSERLFEHARLTAHDIT